MIHWAFMDVLYRTGYATRNNLVSLAASLSTEVQRLRSLLGRVGRETDALRRAARKAGSVGPEYKPSRACFGWPFYWRR
jgi:hypothetical protein